MKRCAFLLLFAVAAHAAPPAEWMGTPGARAEYVDEPVFGGRVALYRAGPAEAKTVVLVHGLGKPAARDWSALIPALARRHEVIALDLPGFGHSDKGNHHYSPDNYVRVLDAVVAKPQRFTLVGHSMGAAVAIAYAAAHPERVERLVLLDAAGVLHRSVYVEFLAHTALKRALGADSPLFEPLTRAIRSRAENWPVDDELALERAGVRQRLLRGEPAAIAAVGMTGYDFTRALRAIRAPTLVLWGAEDRIAPLRTGHALAAAIPGARLLVLPAGHAPQIELSDRFNAILLDELDDALPVRAYALPSGPVRGGRIARCDSRRGEEFGGEFEMLVLEDCRDARIVDARIGRLHAVRSTVRIVNSHIREEIQARHSRLELTGGSVGGPLTLDATSFDAAATHFDSQPLAANSGEDPVVVRLSVSEVSRPGNAPRELHEIVRLAPGETLIR